jgi:hypothetical protein
MSQAIEQAERQEPVGSVVEDDNDFGRVKAILDQDARVQLAVGTQLYTHAPTAPTAPAQQPLTDEQIEAIAAALGFNESGPHFAFARAIEAHIKGAL